MICPFRKGIKYQFKVSGNDTLISGEEEYYPECVKEECPFFTYPASCARVDLLMEDE